MSTTRLSTESRELRYERRVIERERATERRMGRIRRSAETGREYRKGN